MYIKFIYQNNCESAAIIDKEETCALGFYIKKQNLSMTSWLFESV